MKHPVTTCCFAYPGTYGHECGKPATMAGVAKSDLTADGYFYAGRCPECVKIKGGENARMLRFEALNGQANDWGRP